MKKQQIIIGLVLTVPFLALANVQDHLMPNYLPSPVTCPSGCSIWTNIANVTEQAILDKTWENGKAPIGASNTCAMPAASAGQDLGDGDYNDLIINSFAGPWCYCTTPALGKKHLQYCQPDPSKLNNPEQINLQLAKQDVVVVSFVTREEDGTSKLPSPAAEWKKVDGASATVSVPGVSHYYKALSVAEHQDYVLHFIKLAGLEPNTKYTYRVKSGSKDAPFSEWFTFRAPNVAKGSETKIGFYGDMGHSHYNPMHNLNMDCMNGDIDFIVHAGDHAYDLGLANDRRGDAYMNVYQPTLSSCPWLPIIGNHEANDGDHFQRYLNMTWGEVQGKEGEEAKAEDTGKIISTAESALGELLTRATFLGSGIHASVPSNTSRYFSIDVGLVHIAGLDLNSLDIGQLAWLEEDLKAVNRSNTPWILVSSHFPLYHATVSQNLDASASYYIGEDPESFATSGHEFKKVDAACLLAQGTDDELQACDGRTIGDMMQAYEPLEKLLVKYNVDVYAAGHVHDYNANYPICNGTVCKDANGKPITNFVNPKGTVHICEGNGGVPGAPGVYTLDLTCSKQQPWCHSHGTGGAYGRIVAHDAHSLTYSHVQNNGGNVSDTFTLTKK